MVRLFDDKPRDYSEPSLSAESVYAFLDRTCFLNMSECGTCFSVG